MSIFDKNFNFSKRQLGTLLLVIGGVSFLIILGIDILDAGREGGIGPVQRVALFSTIIIAIVGLTLIPVGNDPA